MAMNRRDFLYRAATLLPLMHAPLLLGVPNASSRETSDAASPFAQPGQERVRFQELLLRSTRLDEQRRFYGETLGLPVAAVGTDEVQVQVGGTLLRFQAETGAAGATGGTAPFYHFAFNIPENKLPKAIEWIRSRAPLLRHRRTGEEVVDFTAINAHSIYFFDPAGHLVEFIARHNLKNGAGGGFTSKDLLYASEIGTVVPDVEVAVQGLHRHFGLKRFIGSRTRLGDWARQFSAVGDEGGVFIVVSEHRTWLMTDLPAAVFPTEVTLRTAGYGSGGEMRFPGLPYRVRRV
jgi:catechol 2,3-dioxygenase-like lactoylglutathione lyase family enzyme